MAQKVFTLFDGSTTGIADGLSAWHQVKFKNQGAQFGPVADTETVSFVLSGSFNSATVKVAIAHEMASPLVYSSGQNPQDAGTMVDVSFTAAGAFNVELPSGAFFALEISGSGSPVPAIVATAMGEIQTA